MWVQEGKEAGQPAASGYSTLETGGQDHVGSGREGRLGSLQPQDILLLRQEDRIMWVQVGKEAGQSTASGYRTLETGGQDHVGSGSKGGWAASSLWISYS
jgi:hypothetical protein